MKLTVLVDNNTYIDQYYLGEPAVCFYIEDEGTKLLFDTGYSNIFMSNAEKMNIDLSQVDTVVFSHGHNDHTRGFQYLGKEIEKDQIKIVAHPLCFSPKRDEEGEDIGSPFSLEEMERKWHLQLSKEPLYLSDRLLFLGEIPRSLDFEKEKNIGEYEGSKGWEADRCLDDSALVYQGEEGIFIITGCSHSGICNVIEYAKNICGDSRIVGVIGGFHLLDLRKDPLERTLSYFEENNVKNLYPCHCVSFQAKAKMNEKFKVTEVGVGLTFSVQ